MGLNVSRDLVTINFSSYSVILFARLRMLLVVVVAIVS